MLVELLSVLYIRLTALTTLVTGQILSALVKVRCLELVLASFTLTFCRSQHHQYLLHLRPLIYLSSILTFVVSLQQRWRTRAAGAQMGRPSTPPPPRTRRDCPSLTPASISKSCRLASSLLFMLPPFKTSLYILILIYPCIFLILNSKTSMLWLFL